MGAKEISQISRSGSGEWRNFPNELEWEAENFFNEWGAGAGAGFSKNGPLPNTELAHTLNIKSNSKLAKIRKMNF